MGLLLFLNELINAYSKTFSVLISTKVKIGRYNPYKSYLSSLNNSYKVEGFLRPKKFKVKIF